MKNVFSPKKLPLEMSSDDLLILYKKAMEARVKLEKFNHMLEISPVQETAIMFFSLNESVESTKIEGTQATFDEVIEAEITGKINTDIQEVRNYMEALEVGNNLLKTFPISTRMILKLHEIILKDSRGQNRNPGEYRKTQNFIGPTNKIEDASYIPPEPQLVNEYMSNLEKYINDELEDDIDPIIKAGIIHAQFETIHPFLDGNGRLGRILMILYLLEKKVISKPAFFMSEYLEKNKYKYYALLNGLRTENPSWVEWLSFFLDAAIKQSEAYIEKLTRIENLLTELLEFTKTNNMNPLFVFAIFKKPYFTIKDIESMVGVSYNAANTNIKKLLTTGRIFPDDKKRNKTYRFYDLLDILRK